MEAGNMAGSQTMMEGLEWEGVQHVNGRVHDRRVVKEDMNGHNPHGAAPTPVNGMDHFSGQEASSAWFMPFNLEPPGFGQDMGPGVSNIDAFGAVFGGTGSGMNTPNPLGGLHHGP